MLLVNGDEPDSKSERASRVANVTCSLHIHSSRLGFYGYSFLTIVYRRKGPSAALQQSNKCKNSKNKQTNKNKIKVWDYFVF